MLNLTLAEVKAYAKAYRAVPVAKVCLADMVTPLAFLHNISKSSRNYFLLESIEGGEHWGRYSFIGYDPVLRFKSTDGNAELISGATVKYKERDPIASIRNILAEYKAPQLPGLPTFTGGLVGTCGFDFMRCCEPDMKVDKSRKAESADIDLMLFDKLVAFDHLKQKIYLIVNVKTDNVEINYAKAQRELAAMEEMLLAPIHPFKPARAVLGPVTSNQKKEEYVANVLKCKEYIRNGDSFQIVYSQRFSASYDQNLLNNMLVDLGRNDLGRVSEFGSVKVDDYKAIKRFSHVMHVTSKVTGTLRSDKDALDALQAVFPAGTLSGAPKIRACEIIDELEPCRRGIYGGGMGYLDFGGNMDICITIRTMVKRGDRVQVQAGGGIVYDSVVENEYQETVNKARACLNALAMTAAEEEQG